MEKINYGMTQISSEQVPQIIADQFGYLKELKTKVETAKRRAENAQNSAGAAKKNQQAYFKKEKQLNRCNQRLLI